MVGARADNAQGGCGAAPEASLLLLIACLNDQVGSQVTLARAVALCRAALARTRGNPGRRSAARRRRHCVQPRAEQRRLGHHRGDRRTRSTFAATKGRGGKGIANLLGRRQRAEPGRRTIEVCSHPTTIAVGRSTRNDKENGSAFGPELDFLAPGVDVFSTTSGGGYGTSTGTSFAAPCAAGVAALVLAAKPDATAAEVRKILGHTCDKIGGVTYTAGRHDKYGQGRINAAKAVSIALDVTGEDEAGAALALVVGPQFPAPLGGGETQWTAPSIVRVKLANEDGLRELEVSIIDGRAVFEGDIVLTRGLETLGVGHSDVGRRWPNKTLVYDIHPALPNQSRVTKAIAHWAASRDRKFQSARSRRTTFSFAPVPAAVRRSG